MVPVYQPQTAVDLAIAQSLLEASGIPFFVHNAGFGGLYPGPQIDLYNVRTIMVPPIAVNAAREVLAEYLNQSPEVDQPPAAARPRSFWENARMVCEALFFGWFVPRADKESRRR